MNNQICISVPAISFSAASQNLTQSIKNLSNFLAGKQDSKYGPPKISIFINTQNNKTVYHWSEANEDIPNLLQFEPFFDVELYFGITRFSDKSSVVYSYDFLSQTLSLKKQELKEGLNEIKQIQVFLENIIICACIVISIKANDDIARMKKWLK